MRVSSFFFLFALPAIVMAQDDGSDVLPSDGMSDPSTDVSASPTGGVATSPSDAAASAADDGTATGSVVPTVSGGVTTNSTAPKNTTFFISPAKGAHWQWNANNSAEWNPVQDTTTLIIYNSNKTIAPEEVALQQNIPPGTAKWEGSLEGLNIPPGPGYVLKLTPATNPLKKLAWTSGFTVKNDSAPAFRTTAGNGAASTGKASSSHSSASRTLNLAAAGASALMAAAAVVAAL